MQETLQDGDRVVISRKSSIDRYSIIGFSVSGEEGLFVKRIVGIPGDSIMVQGQRLILSLDDSSFRTTYSYELTNEVAEQMGSLKKIPSNAYFVIGDHVSVSKDSRSFGLVRRNTIEGKVQYKIYPFSELNPIN